MRDMRFFSYVWRGSRGRQVRTANGETVHRNLRYICPNVVGKCKEGYSCDCCGDMDILELDLSVISSQSYDPGEKIFGDMDRYGWIVIRGVSKTVPGSVTNCPAIETIQKIGNVEERYWFEIDNQRGRYMLYDHNSTPHEEWENEEVVQFFKLIREKIYNKWLPHDDYIFGKYNLIVNLSPIDTDQIPHTDYPTRPLR